MSAGKELLPKWRTLNRGPLGYETQWYGWNETDTSPRVELGWVRYVSTSGGWLWQAETEGWDGPSHTIFTSHATRKEAREAVVARLLAKDADR